MSQQPFPFIPSSGDGYGPPLPVETGTGRGVGGYVIALVAGIPIALLMAYSAVDTMLSGGMPGLLTVLMGASSTAGSIVAVVGMRARPRRFRNTALWLTLPSALLFVAGVSLLILLVVALISGGTR